MASNFPGGQSHLACGQQPAYTIYNWVYTRCNSVYGSALTLSGTLWLFFTKNSGKSPCSMAKSTISMGKSTISMVIYHFAKCFQCLVPRRKKHPRLFPLTKSPARPLQGDATFRTSRDHGDHSSHVNYSYKVIINYGIISS